MAKQQSKKCFYHFWMFKYSLFRWKEKKIGKKIRRKKRRRIENKRKFFFYYWHLDGEKMRGKKIVFYCLIEWKCKREEKKRKEINIKLQI